MVRLPSRLIKIFLFFVLPLYAVSLFVLPVYSNDLATLESDLSKLEDEKEQKSNVLSSIEARIKEIKNSNYSILEQIELINNEITTLEQDIASTEAELSQREEDIAQKQSELSDKQGLLSDIAGELYMQSRFDISSLIFSVNSWSELVQNIFIKKTTISYLREEIEKVSGEFSNLADAKANLDAQKEVLDAQKDGLEASYELLAEEKSNLQSELYAQNVKKSSLSAEITDINSKLSALQSAIVAARSSGTASVSSAGSSNNTNGTSISQADSGSFGVFSIGAYTHRNGMSQWGAKARADAGQSYTDILSFYYAGTSISTVSMDSITVDGYGSIGFEDRYLLGINEVPESWPIEVLKAMAIAARTYAVRYTNYGANSICTTQSCQVFGDSNKQGNWKRAVEETSGMVLVNSDGSLASTQYAAVHGGWVNNIGWDTQSGSGSSWFTDSWDKVSGVSWFYKSWYTEGTSGSNSCGHSPFLTNDEMSIILNAYLVQKGSGLKVSADLSRLLPSDYGMCSGRTDYGRSDKSPYSLSDYQSLLSNAVSSIYSVNVSFLNGNTTSVVFSTNAGTITMTGMQFKDIYNQMAPGHMRIQQQSSYAYFNIEKK